MDSNENTAKILDHIFDFAKWLMSIFMQMLALYFTVMAVFFAVLGATEVTGEIVETMRQMCMVVTGVMILLLTIFHVSFQKSAAAYCRVLASLPGHPYGTHASALQKTIARTGGGLFVICALSLGFVLMVLLKIDIAP